MISPLEDYCNAVNCKSIRKIIRTAKDIKVDHNDHLPNMKTFKDLRDEL